MGGLVCAHGPTGGEKQEPAALKDKTSSAMGVIAGDEEDIQLSEEKGQLQKLVEKCTLTHAD